MIPDCKNDYAANNNENSFFDFKWATYNSSYSANATLANIYSAFQYTEASQINSYLQTGEMNTYPGGGYVYKMSMSDSPSLIESDIGLLESLEWIDKHTAALFVEFTLFNPNVNLFQYCSILFEILPSGTFVNSARFSSIDIVALKNTTFLSFKILTNCVYMVFVVIFMIMEIRQLLRLGRKYFVQLANFIELAIIAFSWAAFAMYMYRMYSSQAIYTQIVSRDNNNNNNNNNFINLQYTVNCDQLFSYFLGFCTIFAYLRFIKLLKGVRRFIVFLVAFKKSLAELTSFGLIFAIWWLSFVQAIYLILNEQSKQYSTFFDTMTTCFQIIMGKFNADIFYKSDTFLAPLMFIAYNVSIVFVLLSTMISILIEYYHLARDDRDLDREDPELCSYVSSLVRTFVYGPISPKNDPQVYKEFWETLPNIFEHHMSRVQNIIDNINTE